MEGTRLLGRHADTGYAHMQVELDYLVATPDQSTTFPIEWFQKEGVLESIFKDHVLHLM